jgi:hypothetical protein
MHYPFFPSAVVSSILCLTSFATQVPSQSGKPVPQAYIVYNHSTRPAGLYSYERGLTIITDIKATNDYFPGLLLILRIQCAAATQNLDTKVLGNSEKI